MASQNVVRQIASIPWTDSTTLPTLDIPRNLDMKALLIRVAGTVTVSADATSLRAWWTDIIRRVQLVIGGQQNVIDAPFTDLVFGNFQRHFQVSKTAPTGVVAATYSFEASAILDLQNIDGLRPTDSNLHTRNLSLLQLVIDTGSASDIYVGGTKAINAAATKVYVSALESIEDEAGYAEPRFVRKISQQTRTIDAANTALKIPLSRGNLLRAISVRATVDGAPSEALVSNLTFASGVDVRYNLPWADTKALNRMNYDRVSTDQDGIAIIDLAPDQQMTRLFNMGQVTEADVILNVAAPGTTRTVTLVVYEFVQPS